MHNLLCPHLPYWPDCRVFNIHVGLVFFLCLVPFYLCNIDDDVAGGVDNKKKMIKVGQGVSPGGPVPDVSKPKHLRQDI